MEKFKKYQKVKIFAAVILLHAVVTMFMFRQQRNIQPVKLRSVDNQEGMVNATTSDPYIHYNSTDRKSNPTIYFCHPNDGNGMGEMKSIMGSVLPEYQLSALKTGGRPPNIEKYLWEEKYTNEYDVFIGPFAQYCKYDIVERWLHTHFNGHMVLFSGESDENHPVRSVDAKAKKMHAFGPIKHEREEDMTLFYFQLTWWSYFKDQLPPSAITTTEQRPKGNGTNFMIYAASNCVQFREHAAGLFSEIGIVHCDGCAGETPPSGNRTNLVPTKSGNKLRNWPDNAKLYSNYRFCLVLEHVGNHPGYITEKILMAFVGGCIPIYHGPVEVFNIFNKDAFIFYNDTDPQPALDLVAALESDKGRYDEMMNEPIAANGEITIQDYFSFSDDIGGGSLKEKMREKLGLSNLVP
jgi:hypothetical protein